MHNVERVVVVTGASQGIGAGLVAGYRRLGFGVVATSRSIAPSKDAQVLTIAGDIRDRATAQKVVAAAKERFGRVDTLVNNAGVFIAKPFVEYTQEDFDMVTGTNVTGLFHMTQVVLAELLSQRSGHIVNITAALVDQPLASVPAGLAAVTKGGLNALTKSLAIEVAKRRCASQRRRAGRRQDTNARTGHARFSREDPSHGTHGRGARHRRDSSFSRICLLHHR
jgi:NAD(P)-dependent dehydrogenase (short-subunit alcohol dehydrogenase family)